MEPKLVDMPRMILVGVAQGAENVGRLDIGAMWKRFSRDGDSVEHTVEGTGYELHVEVPREPRIHFCLVGVQVSELGDAPADMFWKVLPPCTYAVFTHRVGDGYRVVYDRINSWLESSDYEEAHPYDLQLYDSRFTSMDDPESVQDIYVPVRPRA